MCVQSALQVLPSIFFLLLPGFVDALPTGENLSGSPLQPITETVFDLMATVLIASVMTINVDRNNRVILNTLNCSISFISLASFSPEMWFNVKAYQDTKVFFFIAYFITNIFAFLFDVGFLILVFLKTTRPQSFFIIFFRNVFKVCGGFVFGFLAVNRGYVDRLTYWFVFGPIFVAFAVGIMIWIYVIQSSENYAALLEGFVLTATWTLAFCYKLLFCLIVVPSVLWIKALLTLKLCVVYNGKCIIT